MFFIFWHGSPLVKEQFDAAQTQTRKEGGT